MRPILALFLISVLLTPASAFFLNDDTTRKLMNRNTSWRTLTPTATATTSRSSMMLGASRFTSNRTNNNNANGINSSRRRSSPKPINAKDWPQKFPAKEHCSKCGLCETTFVQHVDTSCAFIGKGMSKIDDLESQVHGTTRMIQSQLQSTTDQYQDQYQDQYRHNTRFGVLHDDFPIMLVKGTEKNAQWTGAVTSIAISMLERGLVDAVVCIASASSDSDYNHEHDHQNEGRMSQLEPKPIIAKSVQDILRGRGVKPSLAPSLAVLDEIKHDPSIQRLLFCGVGCAVQAFRSPAVQDDLGLKKVYVLGTNCADNSPSSSASADFISSGLKVDKGELDNVKGYEFMQDFQVHVKKSSGDGDGDNDSDSDSNAIVYEKIPYFSLPGKIARSSIADSCLACFDYTNALADLVVGYMGAPLAESNGTGGAMDTSLQTLTVRNESGKEMVEAALVCERLEVIREASGTGKWQDFAVQTVAADGIVAEMIGKLPNEEGMPRWIGRIVAKVVTAVGPKEMNFASYSIDYHILRNYLHVISEWGEERGEASMPQYAKTIVREYLDRNKEFGELRDRVLKTRRP